MAICKFCKEVIGSLCSNATAITGCSMYENGEIELDNEDLNSIIQIDEWRCPECEEPLFYHEDEARAFLKDKDEFTETVAEKINQMKNKNA